MRPALPCLLLALLAPAAASARPALRPLPAEDIERCAGALGRGELALVETGPGGAARQITLIGWTAAPPHIVHALVADPARYPRYVRNLSRSDVERRPDGALLNRWRLSYPIGSFEGTDEIRLLPGEGGPGPIEIRALGQGKEGTFRWEFLPAPGGGTLVVDYGYYDPLDNALLRAMIGKDPALDAGFNLAGGLSLLRALLAEAGREARAAGHTVAAPPSGPADLTPLLRRGTLALVRTDTDGRLVDVSVLERVAAPLGRLLELVRTPETWPRFLRSVAGIRVTRRDGAGVEFQMTVAGVLFDVVTDYRLLFTAGGADTLAVGGAMKGARFRWDLSPEGDGASVVLWRGNIHLGDTSRLVRAMLRIEPSFEHSANVSIGLLSVRAMAAHALARPQ